MNPVCGRLWNCEGHLVEIVGYLQLLHWFVRTVDESSLVRLRFHKV